MWFRRISLAMCVTGAVRIGCAASVSLDNYETHQWMNWFASGVPAPTFVGLNSTHTTSGATAMQVQYSASGSGTFAGICTRELPTESGSGMSTGWTLDIYCEAGSGATGQPAAKLELVGDGAPNSAGTDTALNVNGWTTIVLPAANMQGNYKNVGVVLVTGSGSGAFNIWLDNLRRDGAMWDDFESANNTNVFPSNIDPPFRGERTMAGATIGAPAAYEGNHSYGTTWTLDSDGTIEIEHDYLPGRDFSTYNLISTQVYVPTGVGLPTVSFYFVDNNGVGSFQTGSAVPARNSWQQISVVISGMHTAPGFNDRDIRQIKTVMQGAGATGMIFVDDLRIDTSSGIADWAAY